MSAIPSYTQVGTHIADADTADAIRVRTGGAGLLLGADDRGQPLIARLFRPEPTAVVVLGQLGFAQVVSFRALALGAAVAVTTTRPSAWSALYRAAADTPGAVEISWPDRPPEWTGSSLRPQLLLVDSNSAATVGSMDAVQGWSTLITIREQLADHDANLVGRADTILVQGLRAHEVALLGRAANVLKYAPMLAAMSEPSIAVIHRGLVRSARLALTTIERELIGSPQSTKTIRQSVR